MILSKFSKDLYLEVTSHTDHTQLRLVLETDIALMIAHVLCLSVRTWHTSGEMNLRMHKHPTPRRAQDYGP